MTKCEWCNIKMSSEDGGVFIREGIVKFKEFCSQKCKQAYIESKEGVSDNNTGNKTSKSLGSHIGSHIGGAINKEREKKIREKEIEASMSPEQLRAKAEIDSQKEKETKDSDARLFDSIKKVVLFKKNKAAKQLHSELMDKETQIRLSIKKGGSDEISDSIIDIKHDSTLFVPKTNISYKEYWDGIRKELLDLI